MELIEHPRVVERPEMHYLGIRLVTPFRGMLGARGQLLKELCKWVNGHDGVQTCRSSFACT